MNDGRYGEIVKMDNLTEFVIPDGVTKIEDRAFYQCTSLTSVTIPDSVTYIDSDAFYGCTSLTSVVFEDTTTWYLTKSYSNCENKTAGTETSVTNSSKNAKKFRGSDGLYYWYKK